jgi:hypothetical protein
MQWPTREGRHELRDVLEGRQEEHHAEQEQQVVVAGEHVARAQPDVLQQAAVQHALAIGVGDAVREREQRRRERRRGRQRDEQGFDSWHWI